MFYKLTYIPSRHPEYAEVCVNAEAIPDGFYTLTSVKEDKRVVVIVKDNELTLDLKHEDNRNLKNVGLEIGSMYGRHMLGDLLKVGITTLTFDGPFTHTLETEGNPILYMARDESDPLQRTVTLEWNDSIPKVEPV